MRERRFFSVFEADRHTVREAIDRFLQEVVPTRPSQRRDLESHLGWWRTEVGAFRLSELTPAVVAAARDKLLRTKTVRGKLPAPATVLRKMASLAAALKVVQRDWQWLESSPMATIAKPRPGRGRVRFLSDAERERLLEACQRSSLPCLHTVVLLALSTGMRLGEVMGLRWEVLDIREQLPVGHAQLLQTKNGERRPVAIAGPALAAVRAMAHSQQLVLGPQRPLHGLLFPSQRLNGRKPVDIRRPWTVAVKEAGLEDFRFHDLRHSTASYLAMNGATPSEIAEVLGHKTLTMVKRYAHLSQAHTAAVVDSMNKRIFGQGGVK